MRRVKQNKQANKQKLIHSGDISFCPWPELPCSGDHSLIISSWSYPLSFACFYRSQWVKGRELTLWITESWIVHGLCLSFLHPHPVQLDYSTWTWRTRTLSLLAQSSPHCWHSLSLHSLVLLYVAALPLRSTAPLKIVSGEAFIPSSVFQVLEDPVGDPLTNDTYWAAWLLFEFSAGGRMWPACRDAQHGWHFPRKHPILFFF